MDEMTTYSRQWYANHREDELEKKRTQYENMTDEERRTYLAANKARRDAKRLMCERCGDKPRMKKRDRCESCDPLCRMCDEGQRNNNSHYCRKCQSSRRRSWYNNNAANKASRLEGNKASNVVLRNEVYAAYGNKCSCCDESEPLFLTIDHIDGDGADHRRELGRYGGITFYRYLRSIGCPQDKYRLQCWNCNSGRERNKGVCPHQVPASESNGG